MLHNGENRRTAETRYCVIVASQNSLGLADLAILFYCKNKYKNKRITEYSYR